jgi:formate transporter
MVGAAQELGRLSMPRDDRPGQSPLAHSLDALLPAEIAEKAEAIGAQKVRLDFGALLMLAVLGGAFIALGGMFATTVLAGADGAVPFGVSRLLAGLVFCLGLVLVVAAGAELFTGNTLMVMAWAAGKVGTVEMLRAWLIVFVGNFIGGVGTAALVFLSGQYLSGEGEVAAVALDIASSKAMLPFDRALFLGVLCNVLVCLAVWLSYGGRSIADKVLAVVFPVSAFVAAGFEHSVANMYFIPVGLLIADWAPESLWQQVDSNAADYASLTWSRFGLGLIPVTVGNIIGGGLLVGGVYWFVYLRKRQK